MYSSILDLDLDLPAEILGDGYRVVQVDHGMPPSARDKSSLAWVLCELDDFTTMASVFLLGILGPFSCAGVSTTATAATTPTITTTGRASRATASVSGAIARAIAVVQTAKDGVLTLLELLPLPFVVSHLTQQAGQMVDEIVGGLHA